MTPERLDALRRQRALVAQHLAWLDGEIIAADTGVGSATPAAPSPAPLAITPPPASPASPATPATEPAAVTTAESAPLAAESVLDSDEARLAAANARAAAILEQYAATDSFNPEATKRGCILTAIAVFLLGTAALLLLYAFRYR